MYLFQRQTNRNQTIKALLTSLYLSIPLTIREVTQIVKGFVVYHKQYVSQLKARGYLKLKDQRLHLTRRAHQLVQSQPFELVWNKRKGMIQYNHQLQLVKTLFICLLHLNLPQISQILKEKFNGSVAPDLCIKTESVNFLIEVDTGSQRAQTIQPKLNYYKNFTSSDCVIYFTNSSTIANRFTSHPTVHFVNLQSQNYIQYLLQLQPKPTQNRDTINNFKNLLIVDSTTKEEYKKLRREALKRFEEDYPQDYF